MKKRILFAVLGLLIVIAVLAGVKFLQIRTMVEHGKKGVLPPDTVTTSAARADSWETSLTAVGSLTAVQGVTMAAEIPAKVVEIAFAPGTKVKRGDLLIRQDTSVEEAQLPGAEAQVTLTESVLARDVEMLKDKIDSVLKSLSYREREIIKLRYGIGDGYTYTLEEVGRIFKVTRERVRQVEAKAIRKLQHPVRARKLEGFLDHKIA